MFTKFSSTNTITQITYDLWYMPLSKAVVGFIYWLVYVNREAFFTLLKKVGYPPIIRILIPAVHKNAPAVVCTVYTLRH